MPVFFLYFSEQLGLREVIRLEAIYYIAVVLLEVPSGYFSDVIGRKITLLISSILLLLAALAYIWGGSFEVFVLGQLCFAGWMAFQSGTNTVFHFESLKALGQEAEYGDREAYVGKLGFYAGGIAALLGGALATIDLRLAFVITVFSSLVGIYTALRFTEPDMTQHGESEAFNLRRQFSSVFKYFRIKPLGWMFYYLIFMYILAHVPYEFYQPYLKLLENESALAGIKAPFVSGVLYALTLFIGAHVSGKSMVWSRSIGIKSIMLIALVLLVSVVGLMGLVLHPVLVFIIMFRGAPRALIKAPTNAIITPRVDSGQRATLYSTISLICRLGFFLALYGLSFIVAKDQIVDWPTLSKLLLTSAIAFGVFAIPILATMGRQELNSE